MTQTQTIQINKIHRSAIHKYAVITLHGETNGVSYFDTLENAEKWARQVKTTYGDFSVVDICKLISNARIETKYSF